MKRRTEHSFLVAAAGLAALLCTILTIDYLMAPLHQHWRSAAVGSATLVLTIVYMRWFGDRLEAVWRGDGAFPADGSLIGGIIASTIAFSAKLLVGVFLVVLLLVLLFPGAPIRAPVKPLFTFLLAGAWFAFIFTSFSRLLSFEGERNELANYSKNLIGGAVSLSLFFLFPIEWFTESLFRSFELLTTGEISGRRFTYSTFNDDIDWLQTTAVPTVVSVAFGFLISVITSQEWYGFYQRIGRVGLRNLQASRRGRDPAQDELWFEKRLGGARRRVSLSGATLGGWFRDWIKLRGALQELLARESVERIWFVLPEPGGAFFWNRRQDEAEREQALTQDPVSRLARAIEILYLLLPDGIAGSATTEDYLSNNQLSFDPGQLSTFEPWFRQHLSAELSLFEGEARNAEFRARLAPLLAESAQELQAARQQKPPAVPRARLGFMFNPGTMIAMSEFDELIYFNPYLPGFLDKDCPEMEVQADSPLGRSLDRAVDQMSKRSLWVFVREDVVAIAFRFWAECQRNKKSLAGHTDIPGWLSGTPSVP